ncbi:hypothetical protein GCM10022226_26260 [Sphaerisporangium flaviroseum]|uniref:Transposase IS4-like domain-containing protein n=1 Tax=Sphaerisporangium flaviroseum TaxID=509199 RepID=A0ABP7HY58_9ACTN
MNRTGIAWKCLPHDLPAHGTVYAYYAAWREEGIFARLNYDLTGLARIKHGRDPEPTACVIDTQSVKTSTNVPVTSQGTDAGKKIVGRKRGIVTDSLGLILAVMVTAAGLSDNAIGIHLLDQAKTELPGHLQNLGGRRLQKRRDRTWGHPRNRRRSRPEKHPGPRIPRRQTALDRRTHARFADAPPPPGPRL